MPATGTASGNRRPGGARLCSSSPFGSDRPYCTASLVYTTQKEVNGERTSIITVSKYFEWASGYDTLEPQFPPSSCQHCLQWVGRGPDLDPGQCACLGRRLRPSPPLPRRRGGGGTGGGGGSGPARRQVTINGSPGTAQIKPTRRLRLVNMYEGYRSGCPPGNGSDYQLFFIKLQESFLTLC